MLQQTKDLLNQLIVIHQEWLLDQKNRTLENIKILLTETVVTSLTEDINSGKIRHLRGLEKISLLKQMSTLYALETDYADDFDFTGSDVVTAYKYLLAILVEKLCTNNCLQTA